MYNTWIYQWNIPAQNLTTSLTNKTFIHHLILCPFQICGCISTYYELRHRQAKLQGLKKLLEETAYRGETFEKQVKDGLFVRVGTISGEKIIADAWQTSCIELMVVVCIANCIYYKKYMYICIIFTCYTFTNFDVFIVYTGGFTRQSPGQWKWAKKWIKETRSTWNKWSVINKHWWSQVIHDRQFPPTLWDLFPVINISPQSSVRGVCTVLCQTVGFSSTDPVLPVVVWIWYLRKTSTDVYWG